MPNRKRRALKGIKSFDKQIEMHREKLRIAEQEGNQDLVNYYKEEIKTFEGNKEKKKRILER